MFSTFGWYFGGPRKEYSKFKNPYTTYKYAVYIGGCSEWVITSHDLGAYAVLFLLRTNGKGKNRSLLLQSNTATLLFLRHTPPTSYNNTNNILVLEPPCCSCLHSAEENRHCQNQAPFTLASPTIELKSVCNLILIFSNELHRTANGI